MPYGMSYRAYQGDPFLGGLIRGAAKLGGKILGRTPVGAAAGVAAGALYKRLKKQGAPAMPGTGFPVRRLGPNGTTNGRKPFPKGVVGPGMEGERKRSRRMNLGNVKALRRADRRIDGFVGVARKALRHTNYKVVSKSSRAGKRDLGKGHVHIR